MTFTPTRAAALKALNAFLPRAGREYAQKRNSDRGPDAHDHVSKLSPYIRHRLITEREVVDAVIKMHGAAESDKFIQEVFWRTYFKGWLEHRPHIWSSYQAGLAAARDSLEKDQALKSLYDEAVSGSTGIDCFDFWTQELLATGYLHNHARMWFSSIWIFTLKLPWALGADFFLRHLYDGDPASNTLSWRWVGGLHTMGKTYLARPDNIARFTNGRFNPQGQLATVAEPLIEPDLGLPDRPLPQTDPLPDAPYILLIHEDDCTPESLLASHKPPSVVIGATTPDAGPTSRNGTRRAAFAYAAIGDALERYDSSEGLIHGDWTPPLIARCDHLGVKNILTPYAPTGRTADRLAATEKDLAASGITLMQTLRSWDSLTWPHANRGFFKVKKKIPKILKSLNETDQQGDQI